MRQLIFTSIFLSLALGQGFAAVPSTQAGQPTASKPRLPYGVEDVLKLSKAQVSDAVIVKYIENKGTVYNLGSETIVYLKDEGVSDTVLNAMLEQPKAATTGATSTWTSQAPPQTPQQQQPAPVYTEPPRAEPPAPAPRSTVHVIPYYPATYSYYYGPAWSGYYSPYVGPRISLGFGFGFGGHFGGHHHHRFGCW